MGGKHGGASCGHTKAQRHTLPLAFTDSRSSGCAPARAQGCSMSEPGENVLPRSLTLPFHSHLWITGHSVITYQPTNCRIAWRGSGNTVLSRILLALFVTHTSAEPLQQFAKITPRLSERLQSAHKWHWTPSVSECTPTQTYRSMIWYFSIRQKRSSGCIPVQPRNQPVYVLSNDFHIRPAPKSAFPSGG